MKLSCDTPFEQRLVDHSRIQREGRLASRFEHLQRKTRCEARLRNTRTRSGCRASATVIMKLAISVSANADSDRLMTLENLAALTLSKNLKVDFFSLSFFFFYLFLKINSFHRYTVSCHLYISIACKICIR